MTGAFDRIAARLSKTRHEVAHGVSRPFLARRRAPARVDCAYGAMWYRVRGEHGALDERFAERVLQLAVF